MPIRHATVASIDPVVLYKILKLRTDVFIHEQKIVDEPEIDGRDLEPTTTLFWIEEDDTVLATLRFLDESPYPHIGRVATKASARGRGLAGRLLTAVLDRYPGPIEISAQAYLEQWYGKFGFERTGPNYIEAGIDHLPMIRPGTPAAAQR
ncbi:GNAT family N-acetyltransferase [Gordonia sp. zg691]|uniref:GNAT family N-acetyltransferase n=1 Tax=Gordonia jinghuaiqii TaxID=2758710 RepID=UPI0016623A6C|nr:GNAT family N-acetyltransferase [Gordonia jinghuaiqii]MBD0862631.1 GNAT family N-acetyltransferase [Gordonia jinghuaiqii]